MTSFIKHTEIQEKPKNKKHNSHFLSKLSDLGTQWKNCNTERYYNHTLSNKKNSCSIPMLTWDNLQRSSDKCYSWKHIRKDCLGGINCKNYSAICALEKEIQRLLHSNEQFEKINKIYESNLNQRERWYIQWLKENKILKKKLEKSEYFNSTITNTYLNSDRTAKTHTDKVCNTKKSEESKHSILHGFQEKPWAQPIKIIQSQENEFTPRNDKKIAFIFNNSDLDNCNFTRLDHKERNQKKLSSQILSLNESDNLELHSLQPLSKNSSQSLRRRFRFNSTDSEHQIYPSYNTNAKNQKTSYLSTLNYNKAALAHYDLINVFHSKSQKFKHKINTSVSFLSNTKEYKTIIKDNKYISKLNEITTSDKMFIHSMENSTNDTLITFSDSIISWIKDYKEMVKLNLRMKEFIKGSIDWVDSVLNQKSASVWINNTCKILNCERASLFIYDKITDMLVVHTGEGMKKGQIKIPKDQGIVGAVFMDGKKLKIDDVYLDKRFNKEIDKQTNFRTKSVWCYPLLDKEQDCFGCIEAINKRNQTFDCDDEELLHFFSQQASAILKNMMNSDENILHISRLKSLLMFSLDNKTIKDKYDFTAKCEEMMMSIFSCIQAKIIFIEEKEKLNYYSVDRECVNYKNDLGILAMVLQKKDIFACNSLKKCPNYNMITDLNSHEGLLTFPITKNDVAYAIAQVPFSGKVTKYNKPKESEVKMISLVSHSIATCFIATDYVSG